MRLGRVLLDAEGGVVDAGDGCGDVRRYREPACLGDVLVARLHVEVGLSVVGVEEAVQRLASVDLTDDDANELELSQCLDGESVPSPARRDLDHAARRGRLAKCDCITPFAFRQFRVGIDSDGRRLDRD